MRAQNSENFLTLKNVAYVPNLAINIVSTSKLEKAGFKLITFKGMTSLYFENDLVCVAKRSKEDLYELDLVDTVFVTKTRSSLCDSNSKVNLDKWTLWHRRLGHLSDGYMQKLLPDYMLKACFCDSCALCKAKKIPHKAKSSDEIVYEKTTGIKRGEIYSDLMGPMNQSSIQGYKYVLTYLCSHTEYSYVFTMSSKTEQIEKFKEFKTIYEHNSNWKIQVLRTDNGLE